MVATFAYDNGLRRTSRTLGDTPGTQTAPDGWVYGRQDNLPTAINSAIPGASFSYTYDANKNKLTEGISAPMANFGFNSTAYDQADRLTAWNRTDGNLDQAWDLSLVGNWATFTQNQVQQTRSHTAVHEIATIDASPIAHDPTGNLTRNAGDTLDRYTWDFDNRLSAADVDQDGTAEYLYRHDALGRRVSKTIPDGEGSATTVFVGTIQELEYSPYAKQVLAEYAADATPNSTLRKFVYAEYIDEPVMMVACETPTEAQYYYHQNSLYSVAAVSDATGTVVERYAYSAYGRPLLLDAAANLLDPQASAIGNPYLFTGRRLDEETSLYYYRARMYDDELGRFVSRDPIGYKGSKSNHYSYMEEQPLGGFDPSGLVPLHDDTTVSSGCLVEFRQPSFLNNVIITFAVTDGDCPSLKIIEKQVKQYGPQGAISEARQIIACPRERPICSYNPHSDCKDVARGADSRTYETRYYWRLIRQGGGQPRFVWEPFPDSVFGPPPRPAIGGDRAWRGPCYLQVDLLLPWYTTRCKGCCIGTGWDIEMPDKIPSPW